MKQIPNHPLYSITQDGKVWSHNRGIYIKDKLGRDTFHGHKGKWLKPGLNCCGYFSVNLYDNPGTGQHKNYLVQHLVLNTFIGPKPPGMECRHLNGIRGDNRLENLCWGTRSENQQDSVQHGTHGGMGICGDVHHSSKLSNRDRRMILYMYSTGLFKRRELTVLYNVAEVTIKKQVEGYTYPYLDVTHLRGVSNVKRQQETS